MCESVESRLSQVWHGLLPTFSDAERVLSLSDDHQRALLMLLHSTLALSQEILSERNEPRGDNLPPRKRRAISPGLDQHFSRSANSATRRTVGEVATSDPFAQSEEEAAAAAANTISLLDCTQFSPNPHQSPPRISTKQPYSPSPVLDSPLADPDAQQNTCCDVVRDNVLTVSVHELSNSDHHDTSADSTDYELSPVGVHRAVWLSSPGLSPVVGTGVTMASAGSHENLADHAHTETRHARHTDANGHHDINHTHGDIKHAHDQGEDVEVLLNRKRVSLEPSRIEDTEYDVSAADWLIAATPTFKPIAAAVPSPSDRDKQRPLTSTADSHSSAAGDWQRRQMFGPPAGRKPVAPVPEPLPIADETQFDITNSSSGNVVAATVSITSRCSDSPSVVEASRLSEPRHCSSGVRQIVPTLQINLSPVRKHSSPVLKQPSAMKLSNSSDLAVTAAQSVTSCVGVVTSCSGVVTSRSMRSTAARQCVDAERRVTRANDTRSSSYSVARPIGTSDTRPSNYSVARPISTSDTRSSNYNVTRPISTSDTRPSNFSVARPISTSDARPSNYSGARPSVSTSGARSSDPSVAQRTESNKHKLLKNENSTATSVDGTVKLSAASKLSRRMVEPRAEPEVQLIGSMNDTAYYTSLLRPTSSTADARKVRCSPVRNKEQRSKLPGWACDICEKWYADQEMSDEQRERHMQQCSRHRDRYDPRQQTPPGFWDPVRFTQMDESL